MSIFVQIAGEKLYTGITVSELQLLSVAQMAAMQVYELQEFENTHVLADPVPTIDHRIEERSTATFDILDMEEHHSFEYGQEVLIRDEQGRLFGGLIEEATESFTVGYPLARVPTVFLNGEPQTVGIKGIETDRDWYWNKGDATITQDQAATPISDSDTLTVQYTGAYKLIVKATQAAEITRQKVVQGFGSGHMGGRHRCCGGRPSVHHRCAAQ